MVKPGEAATPMRWTFVPETYGMIYFAFLFVMILILAMITGSYADRDKDPIYEVFGVHSIVVAFSQEPAIQYGPAMYGVCFIFGTLLSYGRYCRVHILHQARHMSDGDYNWYLSNLAIETFALMMWSTVFAINDEWPEYQMMCVLFFVVAVIMSGLRENWYIQKYSLLDASSANFLYYYSVLFAVVGGYYCVHMTAIAFFGQAYRNDLWLEIVDDIVWLMFVVQFGFIWYFGMSSKMGYLDVEVTLEGIDVMKGAEWESLLNSEEKRESEQGAEPGMKRATDLAVAYETKINPDNYESYWILALNLFIGFACVLTYLYSDLDMTDNMVLTYFEINSLCLAFDFPPAIYFGPCASMFMILLAVPACMGTYSRLQILYLNYVIPKHQRDVNVFLALLEMVAIALFSSIFAVNDENIYSHTMLYVLLIAAMLAGAVRNIWYLWRFGSTSPGTKAGMTVYFVLFIIIGFGYLQEMVVMLYYHYRLWSSLAMYDFLDKAFTTLWLCLCFYGCVIDGDHGVLTVKFHLHDVNIPREESVGKEIETEEV